MLLFFCLCFPLLLCFSSSVFFLYPKKRLPRKEKKTSSASSAKLGYKRARPFILKTISLKKPFLFFWKDKKTYFYTTTPWIFYRILPFLEPEKGRILYPFFGRSRVVFLFTMILRRIFSGYYPIPQKTFPLYPEKAWPPEKPKLLPRKASAFRLSFFSFSKRGNIR